jgi:imidazolonepropionase-like amidohydrolase
MPGPEVDRRRMLALGGAGLGALALGRPSWAAGPALEGWRGKGPATLTLSNATVLLHTGERIEAGGIRVEDGVITELGQGVKGGEDLGGAWIVPGFTDAGCTVGLYEIGAEGDTRDDQEASDTVTPDAQVTDAYNPLSEVVPVTRGAGFSHVLVHPTPAGLVSGQAAIFRTVGRTVAEATAQAGLGLCIQLGNAGKGGGGPGSRMGIASRLRASFDEAEPPEAPEDRARKGRRKQAAPEDQDLDRVQKIWRDTRTGVLPVLFHADRADDLLQAVALAGEFGLDAVLVGAAEGWIVADELADAGIPVLLGSPVAQPDSFERPHARYDNAALLDAAGVRLAFRSGSNHFARGLRTDVGVLVAHGLPWERAIRGLSSAVGDIFGLEGYGELAVGRTADFFLSAGDPLQPRYPVQRMWIDGRETSLISRQTRLRDRFETLR